MRKILPGVEEEDIQMQDKSLSRGRESLAKEIVCAKGWM